MHTHAHARIRANARTWPIPPTKECGRHRASHVGRHASLTRSRAIAQSLVTGLKRPPRHAERWSRRGPSSLPHAETKGSGMLNSNINAHQVGLSTDRTESKSTAANAACLVPGASSPACAQAVARRPAQSRGLCDVGLTGCLPTRPVRDGTGVRPSRSTTATKQPSNLQVGKASFVAQRQARKSRLDPTGK